jgi:hypothetical protein
MGPDEIRAEIERRKQRAKDIGIREMLWRLYYGCLDQYPNLIENGSPMAYPGIKDTFSMSVLPSTRLFPSSSLFEFKIGMTPYQIQYREGPEEVRDWHGGGFSRCSVTHSSIVLRVDGEEVLDFSIRRSVRDEEWGPVFDNSMGDITRFIEGPWFQELTDLVMKIRAHEKSVRDQRNAPKLGEMKKRFGI